MDPAHITSCRICGMQRPTVEVEFNRNVGMLFARRLYTINAVMCRACIHKKFWEFEGLSLLLGPWGYISAVVTPIFLLQNMYRYVRALYQLRGAPDIGVSAVVTPPISNSIAQEQSRSAWNKMVGIAVACAFILGVPAYEHHKRIAKLHQMAAISARHDAREAAIEANHITDGRMYLPEARQKARTFPDATCGEDARYIKEISDANDGKPEAVNQVNYDAERKVCADSTAILDDLDRADWTAGAEPGSMVVRDGNLKERLRSEYAKLATDDKALTAAMANADHEYKREQSYGRQK